eukprot:g14632.t1
MNRDDPRASFAKGSSFCKAECITLPAYDEHGNERHAVSFAYCGAVCHHYARLDAPWNSVAYLALHKSQLVWFRYLYCCFSSYFLVNKVTWVDVDSVLVSRSKSKNHAAAGKNEVFEGAGAVERNAKSSNSSSHLADGSDYLDGSTTENETTDIPETDCSILTATTVTLGGGGGQHQQATPLHKSVMEMITPLHARTLRRTSVRTSTKPECGGAQGPEAGMPKIRAEDFYNQNENLDGEMLTAKSNEKEKDGAGGAEQAQAALAQGHQGVPSNAKGKGAEEGLHDQSSFLKTEVADSSSAGQTAGIGHLPGDGTISMKSSDTDRSCNCKKNNKVKASSARGGKADVTRSSGSEAIVEAASAVGEEQEEISTGELKLVSQEQKWTSPRRECEAFCDVSSIHEGDSLIDLVEHLTDVSPIKTTEEAPPPSSAKQDGGNRAAKAIEKTEELQGVEVMEGAGPSSAVEGEIEKAKVENVVAAPTESNATTTTSVLGQVGDCALQQAKTAEKNNSPCAGTKRAEEQPQTYEEMKEQPLLDQDRTSFPTSDPELLQDSAPYKSNEETWEDSARVDSSISRIRRIADRIMDNPSKLKLPIQRRRSASGSLRNNVDSLFQQGSTTTLQPTSSWTLQPMGTMLDQQLPSMLMGEDTSAISSSAAQGAGGFGAAARDSCGHPAGVDFFDTSSCGGVGTNKKRAGAGAGGRMGAGLGGGLGFPHLTAKKAVSKDFWAYSGSENTPSSFLSDESLLMLANSPIPTAQETLNFVDRDPVAEKKQDRSSRRRGLLQAVASHQAANSTGEGDPQGLVSGVQLTRGLLELDFHNTLSGLVLPSAQGQCGGDSDSQHLHAALTSGSGLAGTTSTSSAQQLDGVAVAAAGSALSANSAAGAASGRGGGAAHVLTATQSCTGVTGHPGSTCSAFAFAPPPPAPRYYNFGAGNGGSFGSSSRGYHRRAWESSRYGGRGGERGNKNKFPDQHNHHLHSSHGSGGGGGGGYSNQLHGHGMSLNLNGGVQQQRGGNATSNNYAGLEQICAASPGPTATGGTLDLNNMQQNINGLYHTEHLAPFGCGGVPQHHQGFNLSASGIGGNDMNGHQEQLVQNLNGGGSMEQALTGNGFCQRTQQGFFSAGASNLVGNNVTNSSFQQQQLQQRNQFPHNNVNFGNTTSGQTLQQQNNLTNGLHHTHSLNVAQSSPHQMFNNSQQQLSFTRNSQIMPTQLPSCAPPTSAGSFQAVPDGQTILGGGPPSPQLDFNNPNVGGAAGSSGPDSSASNLNQLIEQLMQDGHSCNGNLLSGSCVGTTNGNGIGNGVGVQGAGAAACSSSAGMTSTSGQMNQQQLDFDLLGGLKLGQGGGAMGQSHQLQSSNANANQILGGNGNVGSTTCGEEMNSHDLVRQLISQRQLGGQSQELIPLGAASAPPLTSTSGAVTTVAGESQSEGNEVNPLNPTNAVVPPLTDDAFKLQPASTANAK